MTSEPTKHASMPILEKETLLPRQAPEEPIFNVATSVEAPASEVADGARIDPEQRLVD